MLVVEPERRLSISQILTHSWMCTNGVVELEPGGYVLCHTSVFKGCPVITVTSRVQVERVKSRRKILYHFAIFATIIEKVD